MAGIGPGIFAICTYNRLNTYSKFQAEVYYIIGGLNSKFQPVRTLDQFQRWD